MTHIPRSITRRLPPASGVAGAGLLFAGMFATTKPASETSPADSASTIAATYAANADRTRAGVWAALVGLSLFLWFLAWLRQQIRVATGREGWLDTVALGGGIVAAAGVAIFLAVKVAASNQAIGGDGPAASTLLLLEWELAGVLAPAFAALVGATSLASIRHRLLPRFTGWLGWLGIVLAVALAAAGFLGGALVVTSILWVAAVALALTVRPPAAWPPASPG
jgi:hypothetical protein